MADEKLWPFSTWSLPFVFFSFCSLLLSKSHLLSNHFKNFLCNFAVHWLVIDCHFAIFVKASIVVLIFFFFLQLMQRSWLRELISCSLLCLLSLAIIIFLIFSNSTNLFLWFWHNIFWITFSSVNQSFFFSMIVFCKQLSSYSIEFIITTQHVPKIYCFWFYSRRVLLTVILFAARGIIAGVFQAAYVYTPEVSKSWAQIYLDICFGFVIEKKFFLNPLQVYPTPLRSVGVGSCSAMARLGAMVTPYIAQVLVKTSLLLAVTVYGVAAMAAAIASYFLPYETSGKEMRETVHGRNW